MAKYQIRLNIIPVGTIGEGDFHWFTDDDIVQPSEESHYGINSRHWSTTALEIMPCQILPNLTGKKWDVEYHSNSNELVMVRYKSEDGDVALAELCDENGFLTCHWEEEDRLPKGPSLTVFGNGRKVPCNTAHEAAHTIAQMIFNNCGPRGGNFPAKRW